MLDAAGHYEHWKNQLKVPGGVALVLGLAWKETYWKKLINKSTDKHKCIVRRLQEVGLPEHAMKYASLEETLVHYKAAILLGEMQRM